MAEEEEKPKEEGEEYVEKVREAYGELVDAVAEIGKKHGLKIAEVMWLFECMKLVSLNQAIGISVVFTGVSDQTPPSTAIDYFA